MATSWKVASTIQILADMGAIGAWFGVEFPALISLCRVALLTTPLHYPISACLFCRIHCTVCGANAFFHSRTAWMVFLRNLCNANAHSNIKRKSTVRNWCFFYLCTNFFGKAHGCLCRGWGCEYYEFFPTKAGAYVRGSGIVFQDGADSLQGHIASLMPIGVVDVFEMVQIQFQAATGNAAATADFNKFAPIIFKAASVCKAR